MTSHSKYLQLWCFLFFKYQQKRLGKVRDLCCLILKIVDMNLKGKEDLAQVLRGTSFYVSTKVLKGIYLMKCACENPNLEYLWVREIIFWYLTLPLPHPTQPPCINYRAVVIKWLKVDFKVIVCRFGL